MHDKKFWPKKIRIECTMQMQLNYFSNNKYAYTCKITWQKLKGNRHTLDDNSFRNVLPPLSVGTYSKRQEFVPEVNFFSLEYTPFQKGLSTKDSKQKVIIDASL